MFDGGDRELDACHSLQLVQHDRLAGPGLLEATLSARKRAGNAVQQLDDVPRIGVDLIERIGMQRSRDRAGLDVHAVGEARELLRLFIVERDVQSLRASTVHEKQRSA